MLTSRYHDFDGMKNMFFNLPEDSTFYSDSAFYDYSYERVRINAESIKLMISRKSNSNMFPKHIHAVTPDGFLLKVILFIFYLL